MNQNAHYTITRLSDLFMQAGAGLPGSKIAVITATSANNVTILVNTTGAMQKFNSAIKPATLSIPVSDAKSFSKTLTLKRSYADTSIALKPMSIDASYNGTGYIKGISIDSGKIRLTASDTMGSGDAIYAFTTQRFFLNGTNLCLDSNTIVIAENIDTLSITFMDSTMTPTTIWTKMIMAKILVTARSAMPDPAYNGSPDHYYRRTFDITFRLKNKL